MNGFSVAMRARVGLARAGVSTRSMILGGTALGCTLAIVPAAAQTSGNIAYSGVGPYTLTQTTPVSGGPRAIDVTVTSGDATVDTSATTVSTANNGNTLGAGIAVNNTGTGNTTIRNGNVTATGTGRSFAVDGRTTTGTDTIDNSGVINASGNNGDYAIVAIGTTGDINLTSNEAHGQLRGIYTFTNGTTTINSTNVTADGTGLVNAIIGQGDRLVLNSDTASVTNAGGNQGAAIFANSGVGGVLLNAQNTSAYGQNQAGIIVFSEGAVDVTSGTILTTQNSDGLSIASGTDVVARSTSITTQGTGGGRGIVIGGNAGGGGFNSSADGFAYNSATITSGSISTAGTGAYGIYVTPNGAGTTAITSGAITTTGASAYGIYETAIGNGAITGASTITSTGQIKTSGATASGIQVSAGTGAMQIANNGSIATSGQGSYGIAVTPTSGSTTITGTGTITTSGDNAYGIYLTPGATANTGAVSITAGPIATSGANAQGIFVANAGGPVSITASDIRTTGTGTAIVVQQTAGSTAPITVQAGIVRSAGPSAAINLSSNGATGAITASVADSISVGSAIDARSVGAVTLTGGTVQTTDITATGLTAISSQGTATVTSGTLTSANRGIYAQGLDNASVTSGTLTSTGADYAIIARTSAAANNDPVVGTAAGTVNVTSTNLTATNVGINAFGPRATVNVNSGSVATTGGSAIQAFGVDVTVNSGTITTGATGIEAGMATGAATRGATTVNSNAIALNGTAGTTNGGITANGATVTITSGTILATGSGNRYGISAQVPTSTVVGTTAPGALSVTTGSITTVGDGGYGIQAITDSGALNVTSTGTITTVGTTRMAGTQPRYSAGIIAVSGSGPITIASNNISTQGAQSDGVRVEAGSAIASYGASVNPGTAPISVTTAGLTQTSGANANGIDVFGGGGAITIANTGTITVAGTGASGIAASGGIGAINLSSATTTATGVDAGVIRATTTSGAIAITAGTVSASGTGTSGIQAQSTTGAIAITASNVATMGAYDTANGYGTDAITASNSTTGNGAITINAGTTSAAGQFASAVFASGGGAVSITSGTATASGATTDVVSGVSGTSDVTIIAGITSATGTGGIAVAARADNGNANVTATTSNATGGSAIVASAGKLVTIAATTVNGGGDGASGVLATGGTGVVLTVGAASSNGTAISTTNAQTGVVTVTRADAIDATATAGTITATIGSATATGAGADAVRLIAAGTGGGVTATITGALASTSGNGLFIDPPGANSVTIGAGASVSGGLAGINATGATNSVTNLGSIASSGGPGILAAGATTLDDSGSIAGANGVAVQLGAANDSVTLRTGSAITGSIVGGGGTDAAILIGTNAAATATQTIAAFTGFDSLTVQSGYWTAPAANASTVARTIVNAGATLELANGAAGIAGYASPTYTDNGTLVVRSSAASTGSTFGAATVTGTGGVLFTGAGTATLDGANSLQNTGTNTIAAGSTLLVTGTQGGTFVNNGTVQIGAGGTTGSFTGAIADNGTLISNRSDSYAFAGALTGSGTFVKQGAGSVVFGSNYAFTGTTMLNGGSIRLSTPVAATTMLDAEGTGTYDLSGNAQTIAQLSGASTGATINIANGSLTVNQSTTTSFAGSIVGNGSLTKTGAGSLNLTGNSSYTGPTTVNGGRLAVNGSITSPVIVNSGGTLGGNGTVGSTTIASGGTFAPGNSIGTTTVAGNVAFAAGSTYQVEANAAGQADRINATGTATLSGGTVQVLAATGIYAPLTSYTVLTAGGGVTGRFANVTTNMAFLTPFLLYGTNSVTLELGRNDITFASEATTANGVAVANAIAATGLGNTVYNAILVQTAAGAGQAFNRLSGEIHATIPTAMIDSDRRVRDAITDHARTAAGEGLGVWMQGLSTYAYSKDQPAAFGFHTNRIGVYGGIDYAFGGLRIGINGGYFDDRLRVPALVSRAEIDTGLIGGSVSYAALGGRLNAVAGATYGWHHVDTTRIVDTAGLAGSYIARYQVRTAQAFGELGFDLLRGPVSLTPFLRYDYDRSHADGFNEIGGPAALDVDGERRHNEFGTAGARIAASYLVGGGMTIEPHASVAYLRTWDRLYSTRIETIAGAGPAFAVTGDRLGRDSLDVDGGIDLVVSSHIRLGATGYVTRSNEWRDYGGKGSVSIRF